MSETAQRKQRLTAREAADRILSVEPERVWLIDRGEADELGPARFPVLDKESAERWRRAGCRVTEFAPARQPGADAELVERLRAASNGDLNDVRPGGAERTVDEMMTLCAQAADAIARLSAPAGPGSEGGEAIWWARMEYLFGALPFVVRHRWGGDAREMVEGLDAARAALEASGADHHDAGTGEPEAEQ